MNGQIGDTGKGRLDLSRLNCPVLLRVAPLQSHSVQTPEAAAVPFRLVGSLEQPAGVGDTYGSGEKCQKIMWHV